MTTPFFDPAFLSGVCGILVGLICLLALRRHGIAAAKAYAELRAMVGKQGVEWSVRLEQLETRAPNTDATAPVRARALQLLQSGMSAESAASTLGIGRREMRLLAGVSRTLTLK